MFCNSYNTFERRIWPSLVDWPHNLSYDRLPIYSWYLNFPSLTVSGVCMHWVFLKTNSVVDLIDGSWIAKNVKLICSHIRYFYVRISIPKKVDTYFRCVLKFSLCFNHFSGRCHGFAKVFFLILLWLKILLTLFCHFVTFTFF